MRTWLRSGLIAFTVLVIVGLAALDGLTWHAGQELKSGPGTSQAQVGLQTGAVAKAGHDNDGLKAEVTKLTVKNESLTTLAYLKLLDLQEGVEA